ncbi:hypothetical protein ACIQRK_36790 [Streptomyces anulatus]
MRKIIVTVALPLLIAAGAAPAHADDGPGNDSNFGGGVSAPNNWNFTAAAVCLQETAVVPVLGGQMPEDFNNCTNGNVIDHSGR